MDHAELVARESIRELVASYTHLGDRGQIDDMLRLFEPEATLRTKREDFVGRERIAGFFNAIVAEGTTRTFVRHYISNLTIDFSGSDQASGAAYWQVVDDSGLTSCGRYRDAYHRGDDGTWRFASRTIGLDYSVPS